MNRSGVGDSMSVLAVVAQVQSSYRVDLIP